MLTNFDRLSFILGVGLTLTSVWLVNVFTREDTPTHLHMKTQVDQPSQLSSSKSSAYQRTKLRDHPHNQKYNEGQFLGESAFSDQEADEAEQSTEVLFNLNNLLNVTLSTADSAALSEIAPYQAAQAINQNEVLLTAAISQIINLEHSEQRAFLLRVIAQTNDETKSKACEQLLATSRLLDKVAGISLMMSLENQTEKVMLSQFLLHTENDEQVIESLLAHISSADNLTLVTHLYDEINHIAEFNLNSEIRGLALQTMMKAEPNDKNIFEHVQNLMISSDTGESYQGLNILNQQLTDYGIGISGEQKQVLSEHLNTIALDIAQPFNNRIQALISLKALAEHY